MSIEDIEITAMGKKIELAKIDNEHLRRVLIRRIYHEQRFFASNEKNYKGMTAYFSAYLDYKQDYDYSDHRDIWSQ